MVWLQLFVVHTEGFFGRSKGRSLIRVLQLFAVFFCKFSHKISLVTCPCAFPLHKLAQSLRREFSLILVYGIFPDNSRIKCLL